MSLSFLAGVSHNVGFSGFGFTMVFIRAFRFGSLLLPLSFSALFLLLFTSRFVSPFVYSLSSLSTLIYTPLLRLSDNTRLFQLIPDKQKLKVCVTALFSLLPFVP